MPSDTIYGLFTVYKPDEPMGGPQTAALHKIKGRPLENPFLLVLPEKYPIERLADMERVAAGTIARLKKEWPGRLTAILPKKKSLQYPIFITIAIRKPARQDNPFFYEVINRLGEPLLAPSLNLHAQPPLERLSEMVEQFSNQLDAIFFDDDFQPGSPSQLWDFTQEDERQIR